MILVPEVLGENPAQPKGLRSPYIKTAGTTIVESMAYTLLGCLGCLCDREHPRGRVLVLAWLAAACRSLTIVD